MILVNNLPLRILARFSSTISWFRNMFKQIAGPCVNGHLVIGCSFGYTNNESQLQRKFCQVGEQNLQMDFFFVTIVQNFTNKKNH
jgi:hypothetical protein